MPSVLTFIDISPHRLSVSAGLLNPATVATEGAWTIGRPLPHLRQIGLGRPSGCRRGRHSARKRRFRGRVGTWTALQSRFSAFASASRKDLLFFRHRDGFGKDVFGDTLAPEGFQDALRRKGSNFRGIEQENILPLP